jgi:hypothetical protein
MTKPWTVRLLAIVLLGVAEMTGCASPSVIGSGEGGRTGAGGSASPILLDGGSGGSGGPVSFVSGGLGEDAACGDACRSTTVPYCGDGIINQAKEALR